MKIKVKRLQKNGSLCIKILIKNQCFVQQKKPLKQRLLVNYLFRLVHNTFYSSKPSCPKNWSHFSKICSIPNFCCELDIITSLPVRPTALASECA